MIDEDGMKHDVCDKCGMPVAPENDAVALDIAINISKGNSMGALMLINAQCRHLFPVLGEKGTVMCEGSPSRAQYFDGYEKDQRAAYAYDPEQTELIRDSYKRMIESLSRTRSQL